MLHSCCKSSSFAHHYCFMPGLPCGCENCNYHNKNHINAQWKSRYGLS